MIINVGALSIDFSKSDACYVIAEIGVNHNADRERLLTLVHASIESGVDIVKLQRFVAKDEISCVAPVAEYQAKNTDYSTQLVMAQALELEDSWLKEVKNICDQSHVGFLCTAFELDSAKFIARELGMTSVKIGSGDITNKPLIDYCNITYDAIFLSTGASTLAEVAEALRWIDKANVVFFQCTSEYPAPIEDANLSAMLTLQSLSNIVGYSDHTMGDLSALGAVALGARFIEKHVTIFNSDEGPDHAASLEVSALPDFIKKVRQMRTARGSGVKVPGNSEAKNRSFIRKGIVFAGVEAKPGYVLHETDLMCKRPLLEDSVLPADLERIIGRRVCRPLQYDQPITWADIE